MLQKYACVFYTSVYNCIHTHTNNMKAEMYIQTIDIIWDKGYNIKYQDSRTTNHNTSANGAYKPKTCVDVKLRPDTTVCINIMKQISK